MNRGEVWVANLNPSRGNEAGKIRPVLVISADELIRRENETVIVLPLTSRVRASIAVLRPILGSREGLRQSSQVMVDQPRALDRSKFGAGPLTVLQAHEMAAVEKSLTAVLGLAHD